MTTHPEPIRLPERRIVRRVVRKPTPIRVSVLTWRLILFGLAGFLVLVLWAVPIVPAVALAGFAVALVLSFPVHFFAQHVPRSLAILFSFLILLALLLLLAYILLPLILPRPVLSRLPCPTWCRTSSSTWCGRLQRCMPATCCPIPLRWSLGA